MNERLKALRETLNMTRSAFGDKLGISGDVVNNLERGRVEIKEDRIKLICSVFDVNEEWLRTGNGEMFIEPDRENQLMAWAGSVLKDESDSFKRRFIKMLMNLSEDDWTFLERKARELLTNEEKD